MAKLPAFLQAYFQRFMPPRRMLAIARLYLYEFYKKNRAEFEECKSYYDFLPEEDILAEAAWMKEDLVRSIPFQLTFPRYFALFFELAERAVCSPKLSDELRVQFINNAIWMKEEMLRRCEPPNVPETKQLMDNTCAKMKAMGRYKKASDLIRDSITDYSGSFMPKKRVVVIHPGTAKMQ